MGSGVVARLSLRYLSFFRHAGTLAAVLRSQAEAFFRWPSENHLRMMHLLFSTRSLILASLLISTMVLPACTRVPPDTVAREFWAAALMGDNEAAAALSVPANFDAANFRTARYQELFTQARVGEVEQRSRQARVKTHLEGYFQNIDFDTLLVRHRGKWLVDYSATTEEMIAALLNESAGQIHTDIQSDIKALDSGVGDAIREEWRNLDQSFSND